MNRRQFLHTVGGAAVVGALHPANLDAAAAQRDAAQRDAAQRDAAPAGRRRVAVLWHPGFPTVDGEPVQEAALRDGLIECDAEWLDVDAFAARLTRDRFDAVVTPYGSAFPRSAWTRLRAFLGEGGSWVNLGGVPCAAPVARDGPGWRQEARQTTLHEVFGITQTFPIDIPAGLSWKASEQHPWSQAIVGHVQATRAFAFYTRLSRSRLVPGEDGSDGPRDAIIEPLVSVIRSAGDAGATPGAWAIAAPVILLDQLLGEFAGGRWIFVTGNGTVDARAIHAIASAASSGCHRLVACPSLACYQGAETPMLSVTLERPRAEPTAAVDARLMIEVLDRAGAPVAAVSGTLSGIGSRVGREDVLRKLGPGFYRVDARLDRGTGVPGELRASTGFWVHDPALLESGQPLEADAFTLHRGGKPFVVTGTTYMAGDVHRQFLLEPNPGVWDRDFAEMTRAGVNVVRTGIWTGWSRYMLEPGRMNEGALRALDAFMLTASAHDIAVVFTFFAFVPPTWGGASPYLDPGSLDAQQAFVKAIVGRYRAMKGVVWDLINEPSCCSADRLWLTRPNYDAHEARAWRSWLASRYPSATGAELDARLQESWRTLPGEALSLPTLDDFEDANLFAARRPLKALEYRLFAQEMFRRWVDGMAGAIRSVAPRFQMITVGQDEGGTGERPSNQFFGPSVDLTSVHTWWNNDDLLWDTVVSKHPARANLAEETGVMFYETADRRAWRSEGQVRDVFERKLALAVGVAGTGFINWIWNTNPYMPSDNEAAIGLLRPDGTVKPEFDAWCAVARFARRASPFLDHREREQVVMVIPHANQFSVRSHALAATRRAVRAMHYHCRVPMAAVGEFSLAAWPDRPRLVILPSPRILTRGAWAGLRAWVEQGSTLLVTGPCDDDEHWIPTGRMGDLGLPAGVRPVMPEEHVVLDGASHVLRYRGEKMHRIEAGAFGPIGSPGSVRQMRVGSGQVLWASQPVELAEDVDPTVALYRSAMKAAGVEAAITSAADAGVLIHPAMYEDAVLYTLTSESDAGGIVTFTHPALGMTLSTELRSGGASLVLVRKSNGQVIADYPPGSVPRPPSTDGPGFRPAPE